MIVSAVVCPHPPLLLRELSGAEDAVADLRAACAHALALGLDGVSTVIVVGGAETAELWEASLPEDVARFGTTGKATGAGLPLSLEVGRRLLAEAGWVGPLHLRSVPWVAPDETVMQAAGHVLELAGATDPRGGPEETRALVLVLADGGARRGDKAPGYLDERAFAFDARVVEALRTADAAALRDLDADLAEELMLLGRPAFAVLGAAVLGSEGRPPRAEVLYSDDPYGVLYTVALWRR